MPTVADLSDEDLQKQYAAASGQQTVNDIDVGNAKQLPGNLHLTQPASGTRPLAIGEWLDNPDGSWSNEITATVQDPNLNGGKATVVPTLWVHDGKPVRAIDEDQATDWAIKSKLNFPSFVSMKDAEDFADKREANWQNVKPQDVGNVGVLWTQNPPGASQGLAPMSNADLVNAYRSAQPSVIAGAFSDVPTGENWDQYIAQSPIGQVLSAFGHGVKEGWGEGDLGFTPEQQSDLRSLGIWNDYKDGQSSIVKSFNEGVMRPAAAGVDLLRRGYGAVMGGIEAAGEAAGVPGLSRLPEPLLGMPGALATPRALDAARDMKVIGDGEDGYFGTRTTVLPPEEAIKAQIKTQQEAAANANKQGEVPFQYSPNALGTQATEPPIAPREEPLPAPLDVHEAARRIAPDTFREYDALSEQRDDLRSQIASAQDDLRQRAEEQAPGAAEIHDLEERLPDATPRLAKKYEARLADLMPAYREFMGSDQYAMLTRDTDEISAMRQQMMQADFRMRDLAPDVTQAYRQAAEQFPEAQVAAAPLATAPPPEVTHVATAEPVAAEAPEAAPVRVIPPEAASPAAGPSIAQDVSQKLVSAGRPQEEADAAAQLVQAHYEARAARFNGALGTADELYTKEGPDVRVAAPKTAMEYAQNIRRGKISLNDGTAVITLMRDANASTFVHEIGHAWLEELMHDAEHEKAPDDLKADAETVRKWTGAKEGELIPTRGHEKFARGFERYLMEGTTPSARLAGVFRQFRDWLTNIYQTVARLRAPINDDIRNVFHRLLEKEPQPVTLAPERAERFPAEEPVMARGEAGVHVAGDLAALHEADARETPPEQAEAVADQIKAERDNTAQVHAPEVVGGQQPAPGGAVTGAEAGAGAPGPGNVGGAVAAGAEPGQEAPVRVPGAERGGGGAAKAEGPPASAQQRFNEPESKYIDLAGNIRTENLTDDQDVRQALKDIAAHNNDFMDQRRGVVPEALMSDLADTINATSGELNLEKLRQMSFEDNMPLASRILAGRQMLLKQESVVREAAASGDVTRFVVESDRLNMIQATVSGITAEWGRAGHAFRNLQQLTKGAQDIAAMTRDISGRELFQIERMMKQVAALQTPAQVAKFTRDASRPGLFDWIQSAFVNALLSGPLTHTGYTTAGMLFALFRSAAEAPMAAAVGAVRGTLGIGGAERAELGEAGHQLYGLYSGAVDGTKASWQAFKANAPALPSEVSALPEEAARAVPIAKTGVIPGRIGTVLESPSRLVTALHTFNWTTFYRQSIAGQAYRIARSEGLDEQALADRITQLSQSPTVAMVQSASEDATGGALMQKPQFGSFMGGVSRITNFGWQLPDIKAFGQELPLGTLRPLKFIDPFVQIQANVQRAAFGRNTILSPVFHPEIRADLMMRNGGAAFDRTAGKILAGTGFMVAAGALAAKGQMNGSGPSEPRQAAEWRRINGQPHGLNVDGMSFNMLRLGTLGMQMSVAADLYQVAHMISHEDAGKVSAELVHAFAQNILDESFMRGPAELMNVMEDTNRYGAAWVRNFVSSAMPFSVGLSQVAREIDPYSRQARTTMDAILAKLPGASEELQPRYDVWGQPVRNMGWAGTYYQQVQNDPLDKTLYNLGIYPSPVSRKIRGIQLTDQQYAEFARTAGLMAHLRLTAAINTPGFSAQTPYAQTEMLRRTLSAARESARDLVLMHSIGTADDLVRKAMSNKQNALNMAPAEQ